MSEANARVIRCRKKKEVEKELRDQYLEILEKTFQILMDEIRRHEEIDPQPNVEIENNHHEAHEYLLHEQNGYFADENHPNHQAPGVYDDRHQANYLHGN